MIPYNPNKHYWIVAGDQSRVYSSETEDYVPSNNAAYQAWRSSGGLPTPIENESLLGEVLAQLSLRPKPAGILDAYKDAQSVNISAKVAAKILFKFANEIRLLKGQNEITPAQFKAWVKDLM